MCLHIVVIDLSDRPHQNGQKTYVYRKDTSLHSIEQALDRIAMPTHAPTSSSGATNTNQGLSRRLSCQAI
jgi:hypothetical protein